jgi:peptidoglycan/xylan/chitin deacetylase (PgdA/CDA1 family)
VTRRSCVTADQRVPILLYHSITRHATESFRKWTVAPEMLSEHLAYLRAQQFTPLTVSELVDAMRQEAPALPSRPVVVTFDDGFQDFYTEAMPILARHDFAETRAAGWRAMAKPGGPC